MVEYLTFNQGVGSSSLLRVTTSRKSYKYRSRKEMYIENRKIKRKIRIDPVLRTFLFSMLFLVFSLVFMNVATFNELQQAWYENTTMEQIYALWETQRPWMTASVISFILAIIALILASIKESKLCE